MDVNEIIRILSDIRSKYNCFDAEDEECYRGLSEAIKMLSAQQWIPCSVEQPTIGGKYHVTVESGGMGRYETMKSIDDSIDIRETVINFFKRQDIGSVEHSYLYFDNSWFIDKELINK